MDSVTNHYEVLELSPSASEHDVRAAHRRLAKRYHPDRNADPAAGRRFQEVQEAYRVISDPGRRARLDAELAAATARQAASAAAAADDPPRAAPADPGRRRRPYPAPALDRHVTLRVWRWPAPYSVESVEFERFDPCPACVAGPLGEAAALCARCGGVGRVWRRRRVGVRVPPPEPGGSAVLVLRGEGDADPWGGGARGDARVTLLLDPKVRPRPAPGRGEAPPGHRPSAARGAVARRPAAAPPTAGQLAVLVAASGGAAAAVTLSALHLEWSITLAVLIVCSLLVFVAALYAFPGLVPAGDRGEAE